MNRHSPVLGVAVLMGCLVFGLFWNQPSVGQGPAPAPPTVGKYEVSVSGMDRVLGGLVIVVCDTETGEMWLTSTTADPKAPLQPWRRIESPVRGP